MRYRRLPGCALALLLFVVLPMQAQAALYGVAHNLADNDEALVRISTANAAIVDDASTALTTCCRVNGSLVASDDGNQTVYLATPNAVPASAWSLHRISLATGSATSVALPAGERIVAILRRTSPATLFALSDNGSGLRLVSISDAGAVSNIGAPFLADCCAVRVGVAALSTDGSRIVVVARLKPAAGDPAPRLLTIATASGALLGNAVLTRVPDVLTATGTTTFAAVYHDAGIERFGSIAIDGTITPIGSGQANCCEVLAGGAARNGSLLYFQGRNLAASGYSLVEVNTGTGAFTVIGGLDSAFAVHGLVNSSIALASDLIFRDGFEILPPAAPKQGSDTDPGDPGFGTAAGSISAQARNNLERDAGTSANAMAGGEPHKDSAETLLGGPPVVQLPIGNPWLWLLLISLLAGCAIRAQRRIGRMG